MTCVCYCDFVLPDPHWRGLERGNVQWYSLSGRSEVWHVVFNLLYSAYTIWKLYPSLLFFKLEISKYLCRNKESVIICACCMHILKLRKHLQFKKHILQAP